MDAAFRRYQVLRFEASNQQQNNARPFPITHQARTWWRRCCWCIISGPCLCRLATVLLVGLRAAYHIAQLCYEYYYYLSALLDGTVDNINIV